MGFIFVHYFFNTLGFATEASLQRFLLVSSHTTSIVDMQTRLKKDDYLQRWIITRHVDECW